MRIRFSFVAEPTIDYVRMLDLVLWSIRSNAGALAEAPISVIFTQRLHPAAGERFESLWRATCSTAAPISEDYRYLNKWNFLRAPEMADTDWTIHLDHDTIIVNPLDQVAGWMQTSDDGFGGVPTGRPPHRRFDEIIRERTDLTSPEIEATVHPWFKSRYPCFNSGVMFFRMDRRQEVFDEIVPLSQELHARLGSNIRQPLRWARIHWNRRMWDRPATHRLMIGPWYGRVYSEQIALVLTVLKLRIPYRVWPHAWNWRSPGMNQGEESPIRILHYLRSRFPVDRNNFTHGAWVEEFAASENPGRRALANLMQRYRNEVPPLTVAEAE